MAPPFSVPQEESGGEDTGLWPSLPASELNQHATTIVLIGVVLTCCPVLCNPTATDFSDGPEVTSLSRSITCHIREAEDPALLV